jgi:hypothetical protein
MRRTTRNFKVKGHGQVGSGIGIVVGAVVLLWSAQLLGADAPATADVDNRRVASPPLHVLVISLPDRKLAVTQDARVLKVYSVAVGVAASPSPTGTLRIINKVANPTYYHRGNVVAPGKSNPLGDRWMGLNEKGYGIHGTNVPSSIGHAASHGCIRMRKPDLEDLFNLVRVGDVVEIHGGRDKQVAEIFANPAVVVAQASALVSVQSPSEPSPAVMVALAGRN